MANYCRIFNLWKLNLFFLFPKADGIGFVNLFILFLFQIETEKKGCMVAYLRYTYSTCTVLLRM
jgi:hypothetical protein